MSSNLESPEFLQGLGQLVLDFGFMESALEITIATLCRNQKLGRALTPPSNSVSQNLELIQRLCLLRVEQPAQEPWFDIVSDLRILFDERNRLFHGSYYETDKKFVLYRLKKGKRGEEDKIVDTHMNVPHLHSIHERMSTRRRQLMDFVDDYLISGKNTPGPASQSEHPSLSFGSKPPELLPD